MPRLPVVLKRLGLSAASLAVAVTATELVLRAMEPGPFSFFDRNPYVDAAAEGQKRHRPDFEGRWDGTWYEIDSRGFRGPERTPTFHDGELRIACIGDSCTFGKGVNEADTWPRQLEAALVADGRDAKVFNLGINGAAAATYRTLLDEHADALRPNVVVIGYNINDFPNTIEAVDKKVYQDRSLRRLVPRGVRDALGRLALYRKARAIYYDSKKESDWAAAEALASDAARTPIDSRVWANERGHLTAIKETAERLGAQTLVFLFPYESQVYLDSYDATPIEQLGQICAELEMPFFDLAEEFRAVARETDPPARLFLAGDRYHPTSSGYAIVASRVRAALEL